MISPVAVLLARAVGALSYEWPFISHLSRFRTRTPPPPPPPQPHARSFFSRRYRLYAPATIEAAVLSVQRAKKAVADAVVNHENSALVCAAFAFPLGRAPPRTPVFTGQ